MKIDGLFIPDDLYYTHEHEWIRIEENELVRVGISDYAQHKLHEVVFVDVPNTSMEVTQGEFLGTAESVKAVSEIFSPISGEVVEGNEDLLLNPEFVNQDPYGKGWIALIKPSNLDVEKTSLMNPKAYREYIEKIFHKES